MMMMMMIKKNAFSLKKKKECTQKSFHTKTTKKKMNPFPTTTTTKNASFCNPKLKTRTKKEKKNLPKRGSKKRKKRQKEGKRRKRFAKKRHSLWPAPPSFPLSLSFFFHYALDTLIRNSPQRTDTRTRAKKEKGRNALSRFIRAFARKGDALFVSSRGRKEREREFNSRFEGRKEFL